ncbi:MAG: electron transfer flavoprotein alpha subunit, partial [Sphingobacteriales bacterium]
RSKSNLIMSVVVFVDAHGGSLAKSATEGVFYAKQVADKLGTDVTALTYGSVASADLEILGKFGASKVVVARSIKEVDGGQLSNFVHAQATQNSANVLVFSHDFSGKTLASRVAVKFKAGLVAGAIDFPVMDNGFVVKKSVFSGKAFAHSKVNTEVKVISILPNSFNKAENPVDVSVEDDANAYGDARVAVKSVRSTSGDGISLSEAELVVSAGRGLKGPENWGMVDELAKLIGAATACSRPVADIGWRPHHEHVGQTGVAIRPNLYIAIGISGAIQHLAGVNGSKVIVVINKDPEAPFFKAADYGIVGDAFEVVPKFIEEIKKLYSAN